MVQKLYVGNLPYAFTQDDLIQLFAPFGAVKHAEVVLDRMTGRSRGFGFVEMETPEATQAAVQALNETEIGGRALTVNEARERAARGPAGPSARGSSSTSASGGAPGAARSFGAPRGPGPRPGGGGFHGGGGFRPGGSAGGGGARRGAWEARQRPDRWSDGGGRGRAKDRGSDDE